MTSEEKSSHPPYPEMILAAIGALYDENGSTKTAISDYIESSYEGLLEDHSNVLSEHLESMKNTGELVLNNDKYMRSISATVPVKRGRGRPPKPKSAVPSVSTTSISRPRGRPPKPRDPLAPAPPVKVSSGRRGRPPKKAGISAPPRSGPPRPRGRPPKVKTPVVAPVGAD